MEQKESWTCPRSIPTLECFRCSSPRALGTGKVRVARCLCCLWRGGSESVSCLGHCRGLSGIAEVILQCDDVGTLVAVPAPRLLSCSLSLLARFHAMGHHTCGWMNAIPYKWHWRPERFEGRVGLSFKAREAQHWSDLQHDPTSGCMQVTDLTRRCGPCAWPVCWIRSSIWASGYAVEGSSFSSVKSRETEWRWPLAYCLLRMITENCRAHGQERERSE